MLSCQQTILPGQPSVSKVCWDVNSNFLALQSASLSDEIYITIVSPAEAQVIWGATELFHTEYSFVCHFTFCQSIERHDTAVCVSLQHYLLIDKRDPQAEGDNVALAWSPFGTHISLLVARSGCIQAWTRTTSSSHSHAWHNSLITNAVSNLGTCLLARYPALCSVHGHEQLALGKQPPTKPGTSIALYCSDSYLPTPFVGLGQRTKASPKT